MIFESTIRSILEPKPLSEMDIVREYYENEISLLNMIIEEQEESTTIIDEFTIIHENIITDIIKAIGNIFKKFFEWIGGLFGKSSGGGGGGESSSKSPTEKEKEFEKIKEDLKKDKEEFDKKHNERMEKLEDYKKRAKDFKNNYNDLKKENERLKKEGEKQSEELKKLEKESNTSKNKEEAMNNRILTKLKTLGYLGHNRVKGVEDKITSPGVYLIEAKKLDSILDKTRKIGSSKFEAHSLVNIYMDTGKSNSNDYFQKINEALDLYDKESNAVYTKFNIEEIYTFTKISTESILNVHIDSAKNVENNVKTVKEYYNQELKKINDATKQVKNAVETHIKREKDIANAIKTYDKNYNEKDEENTNKLIGKYTAISNRFVQIMGRRINYINYILKYVEKIERNPFYFYHKEN